jgi:hypothetical protein
MYVCIGTVYHKDLVLRCHNLMLVTKLNSINLETLIDNFDFCYYYYLYHHHHYSDVTNCLVLVFVCVPFTHAYLVIGPRAVELAWE